MARVPTKLVSWHLLKLHDHIPMTDSCMRPVIRVGGETLISGYVLVDRQTDRVVAGLVAWRSAEAASHGGKTTVKVVCRYCDGVPDTFANAWPQIEAAASQLSKTERAAMLQRLLECEAACVKDDKGRRVAKDLDISLRTLKRIRDRARKAKQSAQSGATRKSRAPKESHTHKTTHSAADVTVAPKSPEDPTPGEASHVASDTPMPTTTYGLDAAGPGEALTTASSDPASWLASNPVAASSNPGAAAPDFETIPSDGAEVESAPTDEALIEALGPTQL